MDLRLNGEHALVCGSTQGIGLAAAQELARLGARITLLARDQARLSTALGTLDRSSGQQHLILVADMSETTTLQKAIEGHVKANGPIAILVNNTGGPPPGQAHEASVAAFENAFRLHLLAFQTLVLAVVPGMKSTGGGRIINVISTSVKVPLNGLGVSNTIRGAVANWSKTLANELGRYNITVNNVLPGATETERLVAIVKGKAEKGGISVEAAARSMMNEVPMRRFAKPEEVANAIAFLASPAAGYINGINLPVDGGRTGSL
ncbi:MAG: SDR family oxidoreductase [Flavobacteriales bacterium]